MVITELNLSGTINKIGKDAWRVPCSGNINSTRAHKFPKDYFPNGISWNRNGAYSFSTVPPPQKKRKKRAIRAGSIKCTNRLSVGLNWVPNEMKISSPFYLKYTHSNLQQLWMKNSLLWVVGDSRYKATFVNVDLFSSWICYIYTTCFRHEYVIFIPRDSEFNCLTRKTVSGGIGLFWTASRCFFLSFDIRNWPMKLHSVTDPRETTMLIIAE